MSTEDDICLWCQDSFSAHGGLVIELTTEDFKEMFKHDASCKIIHYNCFKDYERKRVKDDLKNEQPQASEHTEHPSIPLENSSPIHGSRRFRVLFAVVIARWPRAVQVLTAEPHEYIHRSSSLFPRAPMRFPQEFEMSVPYPPYQPQPLRQPLVQSGRSFPPMYSRFLPYDDYQGYFPGNPTQIPGNDMHSHVWEGIPPRTCIPSRWSPAGTCNIHSTITHTRSLAGYQSLYQECTQSHWTSQLHNRMFT